MLPIVHVISGLILSGLLFPFIGYNAIIVFIASWLIDVDHFIYHIFKFGNFNLKQSYWKHRNDEGRDELHIFHTVEVWAAFIIASFYSDIALFFSIGMFYHLSFDFLEIYTHKLYGRRTTSIITWVGRRLK